jgi:hypothetical protein
MFIKVSDKWLESCGKSCLSGVTLKASLIERDSLSRLGNCYEVTLPDGHKWIVFGCRGVTVVDQETIDRELLAAAETVESLTLKKTDIQNLSDDQLNELYYQGYRGYEIYTYNKTDVIYVGKPHAAGTVSGWDIEFVISKRELLKDMPFFDCVITTAPFDVAEYIWN